MVAESLCEAPSTGPTPHISAITATIDAGLTLRGDMPSGLIWALRRNFTVANPDYVEAEAQGRRTDNLVPTLTYYRMHADGGLELPRGALERVHRFCKAYGVDVIWDDQTNIAPAVEFDERVTLSPAQGQAVRDVLPRRMACIHAPAGAGKTVMGTVLIVRRRQPTLILVHTRELQAQASRTAQAVLGLSAREIGIIGGGQWGVGERLTIALVQTLAQGVPEELRRHIGHLIVDEAHRAPAETFTSVISQFPARYTLALTATPERRDGLGQVMEWYLGPIVARIDRADLDDRLIKPHIRKRETGIQVGGDGFTEIVSRLVAHPARNRLIVGDVAREAARGHACLVLSERVDHVEEISQLLAQEGIDASALHGRQGAGERADTVRRLASGHLNVVVATSSLVGEGFDCPRLSALFLATPVSWQGRTVQYIGRVSRTAPNKTDALVVDYVDHHPIFFASFKKRMAVYRSQGLEVTVERTSQATQRALIWPAPGRKVRP